MMAMTACIMKGDAEGRDSNPQTYSLSVDVETFSHKTYPSIYISNQIVTSYLSTNSNVK